MKRIENVNKWMKGKTVKKVDTSAANGSTILFEDGTGVWVEAENIGPPVGLIGPIYYEIDPTKPVHEQ